jgi:hypothetical protein
MRVEAEDIGGQDPMIITALEDPAGTADTSATRTAPASSRACMVEGENPTVVLETKYVGTVNCG